jgi:sugar porter (SP) family MFS transporter
MSANTFTIAGREFPAVTWYKDPGLRRTYLVLFLVILTSATNGYDGSMMNGLQTLPYWQNYFKNPTGSTLGLLNAIMSIGSLAAIPAVPYAADILGRRSGILIGCIIMVVGVVLQSVSVNISMFIAARFLIGFGVAIAHGSSPLLITELVHPQHRAIFTSIYNTMWYMGAIIAAWLTFGTLKIPSNWAWRIPSIVQALPSVIQLCAIYFVPESPRWLIAHGKEEKAHHVIANAHANGDMNDEVVVLEMQEIVDTIKLEKEYEGNGWLELFRTKGNRHRMVICVAAGLFSQWSGNGLVSYYLHVVLDQIGYTDPTTQDVINGVLSIWNGIVAVTMCFFVDKLGRRPLFLFATSGMLFSFIIWTICSARYAIAGSKAAANGVVGMIYVYYTFYNMAWSGLLVGYTVEILPYHIRAKGMTVVWLSVDIALFFNQYVNPIALGKISWKYYIFYCVWIAFELVVVYIVSFAVYPYLHTSPVC